MKLELFDLIDETIKTMNLQYPTFQYIETKVHQCFEQILDDAVIEYISIDSRIKQQASLKEKIIRNKYYLTCDHAEDVLLQLHDLIGITVECQFISEENVIYSTILKYFENSDQEFYRCKFDEFLYLNCRTVQPQTQRNGFTIYRLDGYYLFNGHQVNFELQIKSLVHRFWSDIEHQVVYKNTHFLYNDSFMKQMLSSVHDSLEVIDHQLQIISKQMNIESYDNQDFGMSEKGFKMFLVKAINDLYNQKMVDSVGFTTDFKRCSAILSQFIYIHEFLPCENPIVKMLEYFEHFNLLKTIDLDFTAPIILKEEYEYEDDFSRILGEYWKSIMNVDYEWHVFFIMMFAIDPNNNNQVFHYFIKVVKTMLVQPSWFNQQLKEVDEEKARLLRQKLLSQIASSLIQIGKIEMIHEDKLLSLMEMFRNYVESLKIEQLNEQELLSNLNSKIINLF